MRQHKGTVKRSQSGFIIDPQLYIVGLGLIICGVIVVFSSSVFVSNKHYQMPFYFAIRHLVHLAMALVFFVIANKIPVEFYQRNKALLLLLTLLCLVIVLVPGMGPEIKGAKRWLRLPGFMIQTSDIAKLLIIIWMSAFYHHTQTSHTQQSNRWYIPLCLLMICDVLLLLQPDMGSAVVLTCIVLHIMFVAGVQLVFFIQLGLSMTLSGIMAIMLAPYRVARITAFLDPWRYALGSGYQLTQSLMAIGRGGAFGVGAGKGLHKAFYLPEAHTDFVFSMLCEEFGLVTGLAVLAAFVFITLKILYWSWQFSRARQYFYAYYSAGFACWIGAQSIISISVNVGLLPTKGLVLPFMSYGGTHMIIFAYAAGVFNQCLAKINKHRK
ncbi:MAG: putative lipid II flippase FtsW [Pseudomonadota bacterium]|nr:putative lipid II flippase FtsW [Pseudomonadota bacterium]